MSFQEVLDFTIFEFQGVHLTISSVIALVFIYLGVKFVQKLFRVFLRRTNESKKRFDKAKEHTISQVFKYIVYVIAFVLGSESLGLDITSILVASAALLVGVGLGLQEVFKDIFSGVVLLFEGTFKVGDVIEINNMVAQVVQIELRTSHVETRDGTIIIVPNSKLVNDNIINWTLNRKETRFKITVGVAYGSDTEKVRYLLSKCARSHPATSKAKNVVVIFRDFGDSALVFNLYFWSLHSWNIEKIMSDIRFSIDETFRENDIHIPFPQRDLHIVSDKTKESTDVTKDSSPH